MRLGLAGRDVRKRWRGRAGRVLAPWKEVRGSRRQSQKRKKTTMECFPVRYLRDEDKAETSEGKRNSAPSPLCPQSRRPIPYESGARKKGRSRSARSGDRGRGVRLPGRQAGRPRRVEPDSSGENRTECGRKFCSR